MVWQRDATCLINMVDSNLEAEEITWTKDEEDLRDGIETDSFNSMAFDEVGKEDSGVYFVHFILVRYNGTIRHFSFKVTVIVACEL